MASFYIAADALVEKDGEYLMIKEGKERCRDTWNIPGGAVEHGENPVEAVKREVFEETGLEVTEIKGLLGVVEGRATNDQHPIFVFVFSCEVEDREPDPEFDEEILEACFMTEKEIRNCTLRNTIVLEALDMQDNLLPVENFSDYSHPYLE